MTSSWSLIELVLAFFAGSLAYSLAGRFLHPLPRLSHLIARLNPFHKEKP